VFSYGVVERRGRWTLTYDHAFGGDTGALQSKLDLNPPPWLRPAADWPTSASTDLFSYQKCRIREMRRALANLMKDIVGRRSDRAGQRSAGCPGMPRPGR